jgi:hypothetical protein
MSPRPLRPIPGVATGLLAACLLGTTLSAQNRFDVLAQDAIADVSGLRIVTIRDNQLAACYTLFIMEQTAAPEVILPEPVLSDDVARQSVQRIREAGERRDRQLAELKARFDRAARPYQAGDAAILNGIEARRYEEERIKIENAYERVLRTEIPSSYPYAALSPGMRTGGFEEQANAIRRALLDPDPTSTMKTLAPQLTQLGAQLKQLIEAPRLTASGPVACSAEPAQPPR